MDNRHRSAAPTELPSGRYGLSQFFGMGVMTYAHQKSHLDPVYILLVRRARQLTRKIMPYAIINGSFDVIKSLALNIDPQFTEEQVSLVIAGAFTVMGPGGPRRHTPEVLRLVHAQGITSVAATSRAMR